HRPPCAEQRPRDPHRPRRRQFRRPKRQPLERRPLRPRLLRQVLPRRVHAHHRLRRPQEPLHHPPQALPLLEPDICVHQEHQVRVPIREPMHVVVPRVRLPPLHQLPHLPPHPPPPFRQPAQRLPRPRRRLVAAPVG